MFLMDIFRPGPPHGRKSIIDVMVFTACEQARDVRSKYKKFVSTEDPEIPPGTPNTSANLVLWLQNLEADARERLKTLDVDESDAIVTEAIVGHISKFEYERVTRS